MTAAETRDRILGTAARLFHEQGFNGTGVSTILREADVNAGSLYHFFPSKEALLLGVLERYREMLHPIVMAPIEAATSDPVARIFALLKQYRDWYAPLNFTMGCPIGNLALELADSLPGVRELVRANFDGWSAYVERWVKEAGDRLPGDVDPAQVAHLVLTVMEGGLMQARARGSAEPYDASVEQLRRYFALLEEQAVRERRAGKRKA